MPEPNERLNTRIMNEFFGTDLGHLVDSVEHMPEEDVRLELISLKTIGFNSVQREAARETNVADFVESEYDGNYERACEQLFKGLNGLVKLIQEGRIVGEPPANAPSIIRKAWNFIEMRLSGTYNAKQAMYIELGKQISDYVKQVAKKFKAEDKEKEAEIARLDGENARLQIELQRLSEPGDSEDLQKVTTERDGYKTKLEKLTRPYNELVEQHTKLLKELEEFRKQKEEIDCRYAGDVSGLKEELEKAKLLKQKVSDLENALGSADAQKREAVEEVNAEKEKLQGRIVQLKEALQKSDLAYDKLEEANRQNQTREDHLIREKEKLARQLAKVEQDAEANLKGKDNQIKAKDERIKDLDGLANVKQARKYRLLSRAGWISTAAAAILVYIAKDAHPSYVPPKETKTEVVEIAQPNEIETISYLADSGKFLVSFGKDTYTLSLDKKIEADNFIKAEELKLKRALTSNEKKQLYSKTSK